MRVTRLSQSFSFWVAVVFAALVTLELLPVPGVILMIFGAPILAGALVHLFLVSLFIEAMVRRIPRALVIIPALAYGAYYVACLQEGLRLHAAGRSTQAGKPEVALRFDPAAQSLVVKGALAFVSNYDVPVAYEADSSVKPEGYEAYRLLPIDQCVKARATRAMPGRSRLSPLSSGSDDYACVFQTPERPPLPMVTVTKRGADRMWDREPGVVETGVFVELNGKPTAAYLTGAYGWRLGPFPLLAVGCVLIDNPSAWRCGADFYRMLTKVGRVDDMNDDKLAFALASDLLGIGSVPTADGHVAPRPAVDLDALLAKLPKLPAPESAEEYKSAGAHAAGLDLFAAFTGFLTSEDYTTTKSGAWTMLVVDGADRPSRELMNAATLDPRRLEPLRDQMISKLSAMRAHGVSTVSPWVELVAKALELMPKDAFVATPDASLNTLLQYLHDTDAWRYGGLYLRVGDVGKRALRFFADDVVRYAQVWPAGENPALAICRIGEIDDPARQALRAAYLKFLPGDPKRMSFNVEQYGSALFLALLASGDSQFLHDNPVTAADQMEGEWYSMLLDGKARVDGLPNNCHVIDRVPARPNDPLRPRLAWSGEHWIEAADR